MIDIIMCNISIDREIIRRLFHVPFSDFLYIDHRCLSLSEKIGNKSVKAALYCPMFLMPTTKTAVCLQTKGIFHHLYGFNWYSSEISRVILYQ